MRGPSERDTEVVVRALVAFALSIVTASAVGAQEGTIAELTPVPLEPIGASACDPPFASACPPSPGGSRCVTREHATSRDGRVLVELAEDGPPLDLVAVHLVVRTAAGAFVRRQIGERGVGCGTFELYAAHFSVDELRVRDVLFGPAPEVIVRSGSSAALVCTVDTSPPSCASFRPLGVRLRFQRPDMVIDGSARYRITSLPH